MARKMWADDGDFCATRLLRLADRIVVVVVVRVVVLVVVVVVEVLLSLLLWAVRMIDACCKNRICGAQKVRRESRVEVVFCFLACGC